MPVQVLELVRQLLGVLGLRIGGLLARILGRGELLDHRGPGQRAGGDDADRAAEQGGDAAQHNGEAPGRHYCGADHGGHAAEREQPGGQKPDLGQARQVVGDGIDRARHALGRAQRLVAGGDIGGPGIAQPRRGGAHARRQGIEVLLRLVAHLLQRRNHHGAGELALLAHFLELADRHAETLGERLHEPGSILPQAAQLVALQCAAAQRLGELQHGRGGLRGTGAGELDQLGYGLHHAHGAIAGYAEFPEGRPEPGIELDCLGEPAAGAIGHLAERGLHARELGGRIGNNLQPRRHQIVGVRRLDRPACGLDQGAGGESLGDAPLDVVQPAGHILDRALCLARVGADFQEQLEDAVRHQRSACCSWIMSWAVRNTTYGYSQAWWWPLMTSASTARSRACARERRRTGRAFAVVSRASRKKRRSAPSPPRSPGRAARARA